MQRQITAFTVDEEGAWVACFSCGHRRHMRHDPPFLNRPWVETDAGRQALIGETVTCLACQRLEMPDGLERYSETKWFTETSLPKALTERHTTRPGVWGRIEVEKGEVLYTILEPERRELLLSPGIFGAIPPEMAHFVTAIAPMQMRVAFYRAAVAMP